MARAGIFRVNSSDGAKRGESTHQLAFEFARNASDGLSLWREQRRAALHRFGAELGLPLGAQCEVLLHSGLLLRGRLLFEEDDFFTSLAATLPCCASARSTLLWVRSPPAFESTEAKATFGFRKKEWKTASKPPENGQLSAAAICYQAVADFDAEVRQSPLKG